VHVLQFLEYKEVIAFSSLSKFHQNLAAHDWLWKPLFLKDWTLKRGVGKVSRRKKRTLPQEGKWKERYITVLRSKKVADENKQKRNQMSLASYSDIFVTRSRMYTNAKLSASYARRPLPGR